MTIITIAIAFTVGVFAIILSLHEELSLSSLHYSPDIIKQAPLNCFLGKQYSFGRFIEPIPDISFHSDLDILSRIKKFFSIKQFHYSSINTDEYFIGFAIVQLNYVADTFLYIIDKTSPSYDRYDYHGRLPLGLGITFAASSIDPNVCTEWNPLLNQNKISICYDKERKQWNIEANLSLIQQASEENVDFSMNVSFLHEEAMVLLFPLGNKENRPAYVHKGAGSPAKGSLKLGDTAFSFKNGLAAIDWTRSIALRKTTWKWASSNFRAKVAYEVDGVNIAAFF